MWGICFDTEICNGQLFQAVVSYEPDSANKEAVILLPEGNYKVDISKIKELPTPPRYTYGQQVSPRNHPDMVGVIANIRWHGGQNCCFYQIKVGNKIKSKRYFEGDFI